MKKLYKLLILLFIIPELNAQIIMNEDFESGTLSPLISVQFVGSFTSAAGVKDNTNFGSSKVFGFGKSTCGSSCFNNYKTTLIVTFPVPTYVDSIMWKEMEIYGNWGSEGYVLLDDVNLSGAILGALPVNNRVPDATARNKAFQINQIVTTIKLVVTDISSSSEIIIDDLQITTKPKIAGYDYWFNDDFANKTTALVTPTQQLLVNKNISTTGLFDGLNVFNFRSYDNSGKYSSVLSHFFYKTSALESNTNSEIIGYEYWLDNDYANAVTTNTTVQQQVNINKLISMSSLSNGVHNFNIRFKDNTGLWSSVVSHFFYKTPQQIVTQNRIIEYRYWFDNDFANAVHSPLTPKQQINLIDNLDLTPIPNRNYEIHFQFKDNKGLWSAVTTDTIEKVITVNILSNSFDKNILIYPNPTVGLLSVDFGSQLNDVKISITDINGKIIQHLQKNIGQIFKIDLNTYQSGVYFITIMTEKSKATYRVIKN